MRISCFSLLVNDLVHRAQIRADSSADDVGGHAAAGVEAAVVAELDDGAADGLLALGDGVNAEVLQLIMAAGDLLDGLEGRVDGMA